MTNNHQIIHIMAKALSKSQVAAVIAEKNGLSKKQAAEILDSIAELAYKYTKIASTLPELGTIRLFDHRLRTKIKAGRAPRLSSQKSGRHFLKLPGTSAPRPSPLDEVRHVLKATGDLRGSTGRLSASAVASVFGVSLSQLAEWLGRSRQTINKTPDAESLQDQLEFFERTARLRAVIPGNGFLAWLRTPNAQLGGRKPLDMLAARGKRQAVVDLVDDMLTGAPA